MLQTFSIIVSLVFLNVTVQILLKKGVIAIGKTQFSLANIFHLLPQIFLNPAMLGVLGMLGIMFILWLFLLSRLPLSTVYPIMIGLSFTFLAIASRIFLKESLSLVQVIGIFVIIIGVFFVMKPSP